MAGKVLNGKILIKQDEFQKTKGGIIIPGTVEKPRSGTVVAVGGDTPKTKMEVEVGDRVLYDEHSGTTVILEEEDFENHGEFILLDQHNVLFYKTK